MLKLKRVDRVLQEIFPWEYMSADKQFMAWQENPPAELCGLYGYENLWQKRHQYQ
jgi:hypothetical protein